MNDAPSLRQAKERTQRAAMLYMNVEQTVAQFREANSDVVLVKFQHDETTGAPANVTLDWSAGTPIPAVEISLLLGEILYHLRTALEYLAHNLAWLDSGSRPKWTQFPIVDDRKKWNERKKKCLKGVTDDHAATIAKYQPFNGCDWIGWLRDLSNEDKHNFVHIVTRAYAGEFQLDEANAVPIDDEPGWFRARYTAAPSDIVLEDWSSVEKFRELLHGVALLLDTFQVEFGEHNRLEFRD